jgi:hypothetical protein
MVVNRRNNISSKLITDFAALVAVGGIEIMLPDIVQYETYKHLEEEVEAIGILLNKQISNIKNLYWLTGFQADEIDAESYKNRAKKPLCELLDIFDQQKSNYVTEVRRSINSIFESEHTKLIATDEELMQKVMKRRIFKKAPMHKENKESFADALITEVLINAKKYIQLNDNDVIYFITENYTDFSLNKTQKEFFHPHIEADLKAAGIFEHVKLINSFSKLVALELQEEIKAANMELVFREASLEYFDIDAESREMAGLPSLSGFQDYMEEYVAEHDETRLIVEVFESINKEIRKIEEMYTAYDRLLSAVDFDAVEPAKLEQLQERLNGVLSSENLKNNILFLMEETEEEYLDLPDCLYVGADVDIPTPKHNVLCLHWSDFELDPESGETHTVYLQLKRDAEIIAESYIEITYGYMNFNEDGNATDGCESDIKVNLNSIIEALNNLHEEYQDFTSRHERVLGTIQSINS